MANTFPETLRQLRLKKGFSQQDIAERLHVDRSTVTKWELGNRLPDVAMIAELSELLGADMDEFFTAPEYEDESPKAIMVDDEKIILAGCIKTLEAALPGAEITGFSSPTEAVEYAKKNKVALAFLDIEMGRISGLDVCRELLEINPHTNVIYLTAYKDYSFDAWATGACGFMLKPLSKDTVKEWIPRLRYPIRNLD